MRTKKLLPLAALALGLSLGACKTSRGTAAGAAGTDGFQAPSLPLPELSEPRALPAARVLHLFYTGNVAGDLEPCG